MPFNAQGLYQRLFDWRTDRDAGTKILAERVDQETDGIVQAINDLIQGNVALKGPVKNVNGTAANPAYTFGADTDSGLFRKSDGSIGVAVGGTEVGSFPASFFTGISDHHSATSNPHGVTAAQLGDYETGTWTPTVSAGSVSVSEAKYVKVGNLVTLTARLFDFTDRSSGAQIVLSGLPFVMQNLAYGPAMFRNVSGAENGVAVYGSPGNSSLQMLANGAANAWTAVDFNDLNSTSSEIRFTVSYFTF